jgi:hypothetical protein
MRKSTAETAANFRRAASRYLSRARLVELLGEDDAALLVARYAGQLQVPRASDTAACDALAAVIGAAGASALVGAYGGRLVGLPARVRPLAASIREMSAAGMTANTIAGRLGCTVGYASGSSAAPAASSRLWK